MLGAGAGAQPHAVPHDLGPAGDLQEIAAGEIDEEEAGARVLQHVAERVEEAVAGIVGDDERAGIVDTDEAGTAAAVRDIDAVLPLAALAARERRDEEGVGPRDERAGGRGEPREILDAPRAASRCPPLIGAT